MNSASTAPKVFISYSHDSQEHKDRILELANRLRGSGVDCNIDQYEESPAEGWPRWMMNQLEWADFVVVVCTQQYNRRFRGQEEPNIGRGVTWEGAIISQELYDSHVKSTKFVPVVFSSGDENFIPVMIRGFSRYLLNTQEEYTKLYRRLTNQQLNPKSPLGEKIELSLHKLPALPPRERKLLPTQLIPEQKEDDFCPDDIVDYTQLEGLLKTAEWQKADQKTKEILLFSLKKESNGKLGVKDIRNIQDEILLAIDELWMKFSGQQFGFSIQRNIWQDILRPKKEFFLKSLLPKKTTPNDNDKDNWYKFGETLGWYQTNNKTSKKEWIQYRNLDFTLEAPKGHLPYFRDWWKNKRYQHEDKRFLASMERIDRLNK
jgi:GUN4-like/SEFIR domain